jgi:hypothetical protein
VNSGSRLPVLIESISGAASGMPITSTPQLPQKLWWYSLPESPR